jgi:hypothetical protein
MADDKKGDKKVEKKPVSALAGWDPVEIFVVLLLVSAIAGFLSSSLSSIASGNLGSGLSFFGIPLSSFVSFFEDVSPFLKFLSFVFSGLLFAGAVTLAQLRNEVMREEKAKLYPGGVPQNNHNNNPFNTPIVQSDPIRERWDKIMELINSDVESNWRAAIIDADIILDELLDNLNLPGDTIGEKLKAVEKSDFNTLDMAWEAHKVRNEIAHGGQGFNLNQREAKHTVSLFEAVFREFHMI